MQTHNRQRCKDIFDRARKLPSSQRDALLNDACGSDAELRAHVAQLLADLDAAGDLLADPTLAPPQSAPNHWVGSNVGSYEPLQGTAESAPPEL